MNGTIGPRGEACQLYAKLLEQKFNIPVKMVDERLTTMQAERVLIEADVSPKTPKPLMMVLPIDDGLSKYSKRKL